MSLEEVRRSALDGRLIVVLGAGASIALTPKTRKAQNWLGLIKSGLDYGKERGLIKEAQHARHLDALQSADIDDLLGAAEFVSRKLGAPDGDAYARWMRSLFDSWVPEQGGMQNALKTIEDQKIQIATLNYDTMAEACTGLPSVDFVDTQQLLPWLRKEKKGILHLHGVWTNPSACVFGIRDYHNALSNEIRGFVQKSLSSLNQILFVGCGDTFSDPNFSALIAWLRKNVGANSPQHYALVRNDEVDNCFSNPAWHGFVEPIGYGERYSDLPGFLLDCFPTRVSPKTRVGKVKVAKIQSTQVIESYRRFLLRDCGEMAIEGMPGDMDASQRKFDIEKLFVPLQVVGVEPVISASDTEKEAKLQEWKEKHAVPSDFAKMFEENKKISLLALPGGGKTLLLKRLAVAYANPSRRKSSPDNLPDLGLVPVMIRCREWKDHIHQPIPTLLRSISKITGDLSLNSLMEALEKHLKSGSVLLLVDGLDEIHSDRDRAVFVENLEKFIELHPKIRLIVTSREAGFDLIAPCLNRFCSKFRISPLNSEAVAALCEHWHRLMSGGTPEAMIEAQEVARRLLTNESLRMLAGNPLLCTMLLVVKHGYGRLPPDRVTLYDRAIELLLDTWNIKGHDALNVKEAVPQLACVAFELLKRGQQTATEKELLKILEEARVRLPMIGRYAKDSPYEFIKRVELRSSLVLQGGHTSEDDKIVPFYQFRHLTFQEYLSAVAAVEGYTLSSDSSSTLLSIIGGNILSDEWKEVVPMAARLGRSQAGPLLDALVAAAEVEKNDFINGSSSSKSHRTSSRLPAATGRIVRSMIEEANFSPDTLNRAGPIVALFAHGCMGSENWQALSQGPYGRDLRASALDIYFNAPYSQQCLARNTVALLEAMALPASFWMDDACKNFVLGRLEDTSVDNLVRTLLMICGSFWLHRTKGLLARSADIQAAVEPFLSHSHPKVQLAASWAWGFWRHLRVEDGKENTLPNADIIVDMIKKYLDNDPEMSSVGSWMLSRLKSVTRESIEVTLLPHDVELIHERLRLPDEKLDDLDSDFVVATARVAFSVKGLADDKTICDYLDWWKDVIGGRSEEMDDMLVAFGREVVRKSPPRRRRSRNKSAD